MVLSNSTTDTFWLLTTVSLIVSHVNAIPFSDVGFIQGFGQIFNISFPIIGALFTGGPVLAIIGVILNIALFKFLLNNLGEGYVMIAIMAFFAVAMEVGVV